MIRRKTIVYGILLIFLLSLVSIPAASQGDITWWDKNWSFRQEISIPISTQLSSAKFQPIDIRIALDNSCWILSENHSSIRVCCWDGNQWYELESQIYDLNYTDNSHIKACSLVFLIPDIATGKEEYYVYYNDKETTPSNYPDHVRVENTHYYYEPIPGQKADIDYYKITDEGFCIYGVGIRGLMMTDYATQLIFRQKSKQKEFTVQNWDQLTSFVFQYQNIQGKTVTTRELLLSNEIIVDGPLMVEFGISSATSGNDIKTTNVYKYYYSPLEKKRLCIHVKHEILKPIELDNNDMGDATYVFLSTFKTRSESNVAMNMGEILPFIHLYNKDSMIKENNVNTNPNSAQEDWIISIQDDNDLGKNAWVSADMGKQGKANAVIFASNTDIVKAGTDERDGIQITASEKLEASLPGLKAYSGGINCGRNSYSPGSPRDTSIPSDLVVEFNAEFFSTENDSYNAVDTESTLYQALVKERPFFGGNVSGIGEKQQTYNVTVYTHFARSFPLGSLLSAATGKSFSYTYAELYREGTLVSSGMCSRVSLVGGLNLDMENISIRGILKLFNWRDISFFKKIRFPTLVPGSYVVKIYVKSGHKSNYVGVQPVEVKEDMRVDVICSKQQKITISVTDQNKQSVTNAHCILFIGNVSIEENYTDVNGESVLFVPKGKYDLKVLYNGFNLLEKKIRLGILPKGEHFQVTLSNLQLFVKDKLGLPPGITISPVATSEEMEAPTNILPKEVEPGAYLFTNLPKARYKIQISYKTFLDEITFRIPDDGDKVVMEFSPMFQLTTTVFDYRGSTISKMAIDITRAGKSLQNTTDTNGVASFFIPVGSYLIKATSDGTSIGEKQVEVLRDEATDLVTTIEPVFPLIMIIVALLIVGGGTVLILLKKCTLPSFLKLIGVALCIVAVVMPWWGLSGAAATPSAVRSTSAFLIPQTIVTTTTVGTHTEIELANLPGEFSMFLFAVLIIVGITCFILLGSVGIKNYKKLAFVLTILCIILLSCAVAIFTYGFSQLSNVGLGSLQGSGTLTVLQPGTNEYMDLSASWGLTIGVYLSLAAIMLVIVAVVMERLSKKKKQQ